MLEYLHVYMCMGKEIYLYIVNVLVIHHYFCMVFFSMCVCI